MAVQESLRRDQARQAWVTLLGGAFGIACLGAMAWTLSGQEALIGAVVALLALAGVLAIVVGGSVLELAIAERARQERVRTVLGAGAHSIAFVALLGLLLAFPAYVWMLAGLLVLEAAQALRYAVRIVGRSRDLDDED